jgi:hypothetical protein
VVGIGFETAVVARMPEPSLERFAVAGVVRVDWWPSAPTTTERDRTVRGDGLPLLTDALLSVGFGEEIAKTWPGAPCACCGAAKRVRAIMQRPTGVIAVVLAVSAAVHRAADTWVGEDPASP